ncbi:MAG TPA: hypothetical protein VLL28_11015 [Hyphomicrobiaceae bacterium]|nr:hypothetical protein [Hyphomicrobiaceae bacterium]
MRSHRRPAEIDPTIPSHCNTIFALPMSNDRDQQIVNSAISDTGRPAPIPDRPCHAGGAHLVRRTAQALPTAQLDGPLLGEVAKSVLDEGFLESLVDRWRKASSASAPKPPGGAVCRP